MKNKPDDRRDNVDKIQRDITSTIQNFHLAEEAIEETDDEKMKETLIQKNARREEAINGMKTEMRDEGIAKKNGYK